MRVDDNRPPVAGGARPRPKIAFFGHPDVFEDFYPHYHVDQRAFATKWTGTGTHAWIALVQREIGDVTWYELCLSPEISEAWHGEIGCRVRFFASSWLHRLLWRAFYLPKQAWRWRSAYAGYALFASYLAPLSIRFLRALLRERPDVFFVQDYSTGRFDVLQLLARLCGARFVAYHAGSRPERYVGRLIRRYTLPRADSLIASSRAELAMLGTRFGVPATHLRAVLTPIDVDVFRPCDRAEACAALGLACARRYVLFVGRFDDPVKRISVLIRAIGALRQTHADVELVLIGDGLDAPMLRGLADSTLRGHCRFAGWVDSKEALAAYYCLAECLVLPSVSEGFPTVVGEAMACGTPVIGSDVGGVSELVVPGSTGWLIPAGDEICLRRALAEVLDHPEVLQAMRAQSRRRAMERVAPQAVISQLRECLLGEDPR